MMVTTYNLCRFQLRHTIYTHTYKNQKSAHRHTLRHTNLPDAIIEVVCYQIQIKFSPGIRLLFFGYDMRICNVDVGILLSMALVIWRSLSSHTICSLNVVWYQGYSDFHAPRFFWCVYGCFFCLIFFYFCILSMYFFFPRKMSTLETSFFWGHHNRSHLCVYISRYYRSWCWLLLNELTLLEMICNVLVLLFAKGYFSE